MLIPTKKIAKPAVILIRDANTRSIDGAIRRPCTINAIPPAMLIIRVTHPIIDVGQAFNQVVAPFNKAVKPSAIATGVQNSLLSWGLLCIRLVTLDVRRLLVLIFFVIDLTLLKGVK